MKDYNEKNIKKALTEATKAEWLKKIYDCAPSESCKKYYRLKFWLLKYDKDGSVDPDEYKRVRAKIFDGFDIEDWKYVLKNSSNNSPFAVMCREKIDELSKTE